MNEHDNTNEHDDTPGADDGPEPAIGPIDTDESYLAWQARGVK